MGGRTGMGRVYMRGVAHGEEGLVNLVKRKPHAPSLVAHFLPCRNAIIAPVLLVLSIVEGLWLQARLREGQAARWEAARWDGSNGFVP